MSLNDQFDALPVAFGSSKPKNDVNSFKNRNRDNVNRIAESGFEKTFTFSNTRAFNFPPSDEVLIHPKWEVDELQRFKEELNAVKSKLNEYNFLEWHTHTRMNNHAGAVMRSLRKFHPEYLTQAWCKFYEIVSRYKLIPKQALKKKKLNSVHLCEAPGAFVASLNHFLKLNHPEIQWEWMASTLNPYYEGNDLQSMVSDDRFIINTLKNWWFGSDQTGNVYSENYLESLIERVKSLYPVYLVTSDGSISCIDDPAEQEKNVVHLHYIETICALNILERDGSFLLKMFTMFESETLCLMYLLRCCFTHLNVFKPVTSKEGNSEVYVVCTGYKGKNHVPILETLNNSYRLKNWENVLFSVDQIPKVFLQEVINCAKKFKTIQEEVIERNVMTFESKNKRKKNYLQLMDIREITANMYIERYQIRPIPTSDFVEKNLHVESYCLNYFPRDESGTFLERRMFKTLDLKSMVEFYRVKLTSIPDKEISEVLYYSLQKEEKVDLELISGDPIEKIMSSKFCAGNLLCILNALEDLRVKHQVSLKIQTENAKTLSEIAKTTKLDLNKYKILDLGEISWIENYPLSKSSFYSNLIDLINNLALNDNVLLFNVPLLTQFNAGILFILGHFFEKIGFSNTSNYLIMLEKLKNIKIKETIRNINITDIDRLLSVIPVNKLCESRFVNYIADMNQRVLKETCLAIISKLETSQD